MKLRPLLSLSLVLLAGLVAYAEGDKVDPPKVAAGEPRYTPPLPSPGVGAALNEDQISAIVDKAVERAMARSAASTSTIPSAQSQAAYASAQGAYFAPAAVAPATATRVNVLVNPGPIHRCLGNFGTKLSHLGEAKVRPMMVAPAPTLTPTLTLVPAPAAVPTVAVANPVYTPPLPAYASPVAPSKQSR